MPMEQRRVSPTSSLMACLMARAMRAGARRLLLAAHQLADHLVDGGRVRDRAAAVYSLRDSVGVFGVDAVVAFDQDDLRADLFGFADLRAGLDAERLGLVAGGDAAPWCRRGWGRRPAGALRYSGCNCCSTDAKKELRSIWRKPKRSDWSTSGMASVSSTVTPPPPIPNS